MSNFASSFGVSSIREEPEIPFAPLAPEHTTRALIGEGNSETIKGLRTGDRLVYERVISADDYERAGNLKAEGSSESLQAAESIVSGAELAYMHNRESVTDVLMLRFREKINERKRLDEQRGFPDQSAISSDFRQLLTVGDVIEMVASYEYVCNERSTQPGSRLRSLYALDAIESTENVDPSITLEEHAVATGKTGLITIVYSAFQEEIAQYVAQRKTGNLRNEDISKFTSLMRSCWDIEIQRQKQEKQARRNKTVFGIRSWGRTDPAGAKIQTKSYQPPSALVRILTNSPHTGIGSNGV